MRDYIILNGVNSNTITGLLISTLPPITKPKIRTQTEEIDGRDGDIVTKLGYSAYDKEIEIGLYGDFDIDDVIAYFNSKGTVTFSNEPDKFYNYQILDQIDYEKLIRFKKAKVKMHVQPFKYPLEETPVEITNQYVNNEAEEMDLDNTKEAPMTIALKGNTSQETTTGKNMLSNKFSDYNITGGTYGYIQVAEQSESLYLSIYEKDSSVDISGCYLGFTGNGAGSGAGVNWILDSRSTPVSTQIGNTNSQYQYISFYPRSEATFNKIFSRYNVMVRKQSITDNTFEPYTNGASPNPDYPQEVSVVSGDNNIEVCGKNLFNGVIEAGYIDINTGQNTSTANVRTKDYIRIAPNTQYTISSDTSKNTWACYYNNSKTFISSERIKTEKIGTFTTPNNAYYIRWYDAVSTGDSPKWQLEKGSQATEYQEYKGTTYQITLPEGTELCKIGDYQDRIYKDSGKWYVKKEIGKVVLNGSEAWYYSSVNTRFYTLNVSPKVITTQNVYSNYYRGGNTITENNAIETYGDTINSQILVSDNRYTVASDFKTWLSSNNVDLYYPLGTPTTTEITDETLIAQLNALANATSYDTKTHITQNANDKPFILNATALQQGSGEATVNNEGNIYSKPTLDIEGSGTVGIYLDGNQMFSVDLSNANECIIDTAQLEAYNPSTSELMNRQVTGDYSNFKLNAGENQVSTTGEITKVTISNYTRWL